jgi:hypothetical protein
MVDALESHNQAIESVTDVKNILQSPLPKEETPTGSTAEMPTGTVEPMPATSTGE